MLGADGRVLAEVALGAADAEGIYAMRAGETRVYRLPPEVGEHLPVSLEALRNRFEESAPAAPAAGEAAAEEPAPEPAAGEP